MIDVLIGAILALIMFSIGLSLRATHFRTLFRRPGVLILGLFLQLILLPGIAFGVSYALRLPPAFATGVVILAACPGGLTSNFISYLLKANMALAVSLTIVNTSLSLLTIPLVVNLGLDTFWTGGGTNHLDILPTAATIFLIVLLPVMLGMTFRRLRKDAGLRLQQNLRWVNIVLLAFLFLLKLFAPADAGGSELTLADVRTILPASVLINLVALSSGHVFGRLFGFGRNAQLTLGVEAGIQNTSLAFMITSTLLVNEEMLKPALVYAMFTFFTALAYGLYLKPGAWRNILKPRNQ
ncbi:bile acid:sodium symporter family protein [Neolewinella antarctica]|uniref:BASS family bile acid:Na+ symporter n=1 Tax=Neolewinella antarctica TaxID=442734 RepID=A0ABX0XAR2_9BACT|nr:bile acid:sodium symporter [Neolewinella antarctica]NJC26046.1 BASS family bile acid:Na+ symporter [Neolewinella antarctica]